MPRQIAINSESTGNFTTEIINGREHIVTPMVSVVANSVMNNLAYPYEAIAETFQNMEMLPAPASHPKVNGEKVSASNPIAINQFNVGGFVKSASFNEGRVINELAIDLDVANKDERGRKIVDKIRNGDRIGVSTGLDADIINVSGQMGGKSYDGMVSNIRWDHVAILWDGEKPAGDQTFTLNSDNSERVLICNLEMSSEGLRDKLSMALKRKYESMTDDVWVYDYFVDSDNVIARIGDDYRLIPFAIDSDGNVTLTGDGMPGYIDIQTEFKPFGDSAEINNNGVLVKNS